MCKDIVTTCPAAAFPSSRAHNACDDAAPDSVIPDPARDVQSQTAFQAYKNACAEMLVGKGEKVRSNPADGTARLKNLRPGAICAGPRAAYPRQARRRFFRSRCRCRRGAETVHAVAFLAVIGRAILLARLPTLPASSISLTGHYCKNGIANAAARTAVRIL